MAAEDNNMDKVPCTYPDCVRSFDTIKEMRQHKTSDPTHFYCKKCDIDCDNWVDLTQHKVDAMAPFLEERRNDEAPVHIVCEFCGEDFKSMGGRKLHRQQNHRLAQRIVCPGCQSIFVRAALMVEHLERNQCTGISAYEFRVHIQQKYMINELLEKPVADSSSYKLPTVAVEADQTDLLTDTDPGTEASYDSMVQESACEDDEISGGVSLPDSQSDTQLRGRSLLRSIVPISSTKSTTSTATHISYKESWPSLTPSTRYVRQVADKTTPRVSYSQKWPSLVNDFDAQSALGGLSIADSGDDITSRASSASVQPQAIPRETPSAWSKGKASKAHTAEPKAKHASPEVIAPRAAWTNRPSVATLFPHAAPTPPTQATLDHSKQLEEQEAAKQAMLDHRKWHIRSADFDAKDFYNALIGRYCCKYPTCQGGDGFDTVDEIRAHLLYAHTKTDFQCPACLKIFKKPSSLIAHAESGGRCKIAEADQFMKFVDEITGGFLRAKQLREPELVRPGHDLVKGKAEPQGIMTTKYKAALPKDFLLSEVKW